MEKDLYKSNVSERFIDEELASHWNVGESVESFNILVN